MPVNRTLLDQHLDGLRSIPENHTQESLRNSLSRSYAFLEDVRISDGMEPVTLVGFQSRDELLSYRLEQDEPSRHWRFRVMNQLARLRQEVGTIDPSDEAALNRIHEAHRNLADTMDWIARQEKTPPMTYVPFGQSFEGQQAIAQASQASNNPDEARVRIRETQANQILDYIKAQFPATKPPAVLTPRETLIIGKDIWSVAEYMTTNKNGDANQITAQLFQDLIEEGHIDPERRVDNKGNALIGMPAFWKQASEAGFEKHVDKDVNPDIHRHTLLQDRLPVRDALDLASRTTKEFILQAIEVNYHDAANVNDPSLINLTNYLPDQARVVVTGAGNLGAPVVATQWNPQTPNFIAVTAPGKMHLITYVPDNADTAERFYKIQEAAQNLAPRTHPLQVQKKLDQIKQAWYDLPMDDQEILQEGLHGIQGDLAKLAQHLPPPGYGSPEQEMVAADLIRLNLLLGREHHLTPLQFTPPAGMNTVPVNSKPDRLVDRCDNGDGTTDIVFSVIAENGKADPQGRATLKGIPNDRVRSTIANMAATKQWTLGIMAPGHPGLSVFTAPKSSDTQSSVFVGHWMAQEDYQATLKHTPIGLLYKNAKGDPLLRNPKLKRPLRSAEDAELMQFATINLMHSVDTPASLIHSGYDTASFDGDFLVELADNDGFPSCSGAQFGIPPELFRVASDKELKTAIIQQTALTNAPQDIKDQVIKEVQSKSWAQALDESDHFMNVSLEPEPMPDEFSGMM